MNISQKICIFSPKSSSNKRRALSKFDELMFNQTQMPFIFVILFSDIGQCFRPAQIKGLENQNSATLR